MKKLLLEVIFVNFFIFSLGSGPNNSSTNIDGSDALRRFTESVLIVSTKLLKVYNTKLTSCESGAVSAMVVMLNLIGLGFFAKGVTKNEIYTTLGLTSPEEMAYVANIVNNEVYNLPDCIEFHPAKNFFANNQYKFSTNFKRIMNDVVVGEVTNLNFGNSTNSSNKINSKVASQTGNRITNIIRDSSMFNDSTEIVSITATFMTGKWQIGMKSTDKITEFRVSPSKSVPQTFLHGEAVYLHGHSDILKAHVVQINFCCEAFYMWVILPDCPFTENVLIKKMAQNTDWYYELLENMERTSLHVFLPRYNRSTTVDIKTLFKEATGIQSIYDDKINDIKGAIECDTPAAESVGIQTSYVVTGFEGGPVPKGLQKTKKIVKVDSPHVSILFRNGRVHIIGVTRSQVS